MMPDPEGNITTGEDSVVSAGPTPVMPAPPDISPNIPPPPASIMPATGPAAPKPTFFHQVIGMLGIQLADIAKNAIVPPPDMRQAQRTAKLTELQTAPEMEKIRLAMAQTQLLQTKMMLGKTSRDIQDAFANSARGVANKLIENGTGEMVAEGSEDDMHKKLMEIHASDKSGLNYLVLPSVQSKDQFGLYKIQPKGTVTSDMEFPDIPGDERLGIKPVPFKAPQGMKTGDAVSLYGKLAVEQASKIHAAQQQQSDVTKTSGALERTRLMASVQREKAALGAANAQKRVPPLIMKTFGEYEDAASRFSVMQSDMKKIKENPANAGSFDLDLLSQHIAMTFGTVKGARIGRELIEAHLAARSLPENLEVMSRKVLNGQQLSQAQRENFIELAKKRLDEQQKKYQGMKDEFGVVTAGDTAKPSSPANKNEVVIDVR